MEHQLLRILLSKEEDMLVAQCLEHDISVQAEDMATLQRRFEAALMFEAESGDLESLPPAPSAFHDKWDEAEEMESTVENVEMRLAA